MNKKIQTRNAPEPIGPYSQAIESNGVIYCCGQIAIDPNTNTFCNVSVEEQTKRVCENLSAVLESAGVSLDNVVKTTCYLINSNDFAAFNEVYSQYFTSSPARSCVYVKELPKGALVEIDAIANS
ncbi:MAG TPA: RidA family protein [Clostridia bacterium]|nr:RidA family protein [Clostridia bacterium]